MKHEFRHSQAAHCESGVMAAMLTHYGLPMSEPMAFGLAGALAFAYIPLIKLSGMPLIGYRMPPRHIIKGLQKRLGIKMVFRTFHDQRRGMDVLDELLARGCLVGAQTSVYWLPYFPDEMRFHFNAHNLIVYGRQQGDYLISDPVFEAPVRCAPGALQKARFAKGALAARGLIYYPKSMPRLIDYPRAVRSAIRANYRVMNRAPLPHIGIRGIRYLARSVTKISRKKDADHVLPRYLSHIVRMQEEIGTGGAGFRFLYASYLQEAANLLSDHRLIEASEQMTYAGDQWRLFALLASQMCKGRKRMKATTLEHVLHSCADYEAQTWKTLKNYA
jgi:Domain of unknown function (DUF4872)/Butirosin biosynthesis protein H, N-terminal